MGGGVGRGVGRPEEGQPLCHAGIWPMSYERTPWSGCGRCAGHTEVTGVGPSCQFHLSVSLGTGLRPAPPQLLLLVQRLMRSVYVRLS